MRIRVMILIRAFLQLANTTRSPWKGSEVRIEQDEDQDQNEDEDQGDDLDQSLLTIGQHYSLALVRIKIED